VPSDRIVERPSRKDLPTTAAMREVPPRPKKQWAPPAYHGHHDRDDRHWRNDRWRNDRWRDDYWHDYWHDYYRHRPRWGFSTYLGFGSWGFFSHYGRYHALSFWCGAPAYPPVVYASPAVTYNYYYGWPYSTNYTYFYGGPYAYTSYRPLYRTVTYYEPSYYSVDYYSAPGMKAFTTNPRPGSTARPTPESRSTLPILTTENPECPSKEEDAKRKHRTRSLWPGSLFPEFSRSLSLLQKYGIP
jgi:hypothetical protein